MDGINTNLMGGGPRTDAQCFLMKCEWYKLYLFIVWCTLSVSVQTREALFHESVFTNHVPEET